MVFSPLSRFGLSSKCGSVSACRSIGSVVLLLASSLWSGFAVADPFPTEQANPLQLTPEVKKLFLRPPRDAGDLQAMQDHMQQLAKTVSPAVVGIRLKRGMGSGVIISPDGYILSAGHVTGRANQPATIFLADGRKLSAMTLGANHRVDAGLLKISSEEVEGAEKLPFVPVGDSKNLDYGQWCFAFGHPGGFREDRPPAVRIGRLLLQSDNILVTDCTLVGGDSGGPLLSASGEVVGIHSRIGEGIEANLHIPVNVFQKKLGSLRSGRRMGWASAGRSLPRRDRSRNSNNAEIGRVVPGGAAAAAGIREGDIVIRFNEEPIRKFSELVASVAATDPGETVRIQIKRNNQVMTVKLSIGSFGF